MPELKKEKTQNDFDMILKRIKSTIGKKTQLELCEIMKTIPKTFRRRREQNNFDANWAFEISKISGECTNWIMTGSRMPNRCTERDYAVYLGTWMDEQEKNEGKNKIGWIVTQIDIALPEFKKWRDQQLTKRSIPEG